MLGVTIDCSATDGWRRETFRVSTGVLFHDQARVGAAFGIVSLELLQL